MREALRIQHRFVAEPLLARTGRGHLKSEGVSTLSNALRKALDICRECHKLAPFCFYNGITFVAIGRTLIQAFRSVVGHYIAGTAGADELRKALDKLR